MHVSEQMNAVKEIIKLKKQYSDSNGKGFHKSEAGMNLANSAKSLREQYGIDENRYGANVSLADALTNYAKDFGGGGGGGGQEAPSSQVSNSVRGSVTGDVSNMPGYAPPERPKFDAQGAKDQFNNHLQSSADGFLQSQTAQIEKMAASQLAELQKAYEDAIAQGKISVREAERQFEEGKKAIEQQAYNDSEGINAHAQQRGIQNSQQMVGLQMGADARKNSTLNSNVSDRDMRINNIRDRIDAISKQKDIDSARVNAERDYNILGAQGQAQQMVSQGMSQFMQQDYFNQQNMEHDYNMSDNQNLFADYMANKNNAFQEGMQDKSNAFQEGMADKQHQYNKEYKNIDFNNDLFKMATQQGYTIDNMNQEQIFALDKMAQSNKYTVENMHLGHGMDLEKLEAGILGQLRTIDRQAGHTASENAKNRAAQREAQARQQKDALAEYIAKHDVMQQLQARQYEEGTIEYNNFMAENNRNLKLGLEASVNKMLTEESWNSIMENPSLFSDPKAPKDNSGLRPFGSGSSSTKKNDAYTKAVNDKYNAELDRYNLITDPYNTIINKNSSKYRPSKPSNSSRPPLEGDAFLKELMKGIK